MGTGPERERDIRTNIKKNWREKSGHRLIPRVSLLNPFLSRCDDALQETFREVDWHGYLSSKGCTIGDMFESLLLWLLS